MLRATATVGEPASGDPESKFIGRQASAVRDICRHDIRGQQALEACQLAGLAVPDEVAVVGVHNDELLCELCDPPLTSVIPNARRAGYVAAGLLAQMMNGKRVPPLVHTIEPLGVAARQSTDVVAVPDAKVSAAIRYIRQNTTDKYRRAGCPPSRADVAHPAGAALQALPRLHTARAHLARAD